jgi:hypothetical protein
MGVEKFLLKHHQGCNDRGPVTLSLYFLITLGQLSEAQDSIGNRRGGI